MIAVPAALLVVVLIVLQYVTLAAFAVLPPSLSLLSFGDFYAATVAAGVEIGTVDLLLVLLCLLCIVWLAVAELYGGQVTAALRWLVTGERRAVLGLLALSLLAVRFYFGSGVFAWTADSPQHIAYTDIVARSLRHGHLPWWTYYLGTGSPFLQLYGFLFFLLAGAASVVLPGAAGLKLCLGLLHAASGGGVYALLRACRRRRSAALVGGLAYVLCFWHTQQVLIMGRLPLALVYVLLPWVLVGFERSLSRPEGAGGGRCWEAVHWASSSSPTPGTGSGVVPSPPSTSWRA